MKKKKTNPVSVRNLNQQLIGARKEYDAQRELASQRAYRISDLEKDLKAQRQLTQDAEDTISHLRAAITAYALVVANPVTATDAERIIRLQEAITGSRISHGSGFNPFQFK